MRRDEITAGLPLLLRHFDLVVSFLEAPRSAQSAKRRASRRRVLEDFLDLRDVRVIATAHGISPSVVSSIVSAAIKAAHAAERGMLIVPERRTSYGLMLPRVPARVIADVDAWAAASGKSRHDAALELLRIGIDVVAERHLRADADRALRSPIVE